VENCLELAEVEKKISVFSEQFSNLQLSSYKPNSTFCRPTSLQQEDKEGQKFPVVAKFCFVVWEKY
jgi:hypothetical protein